MFVKHLMAHDAEFLWYSVISSTLLCAMDFYTLPATMAKANLYKFPQADQNRRTRPQPRRC